MVELELLMHVGAQEPRDEVTIEGDPGARLVIPGGTFGDSATAAIASNAIPTVHRAAPGLCTMLDLPPVTARDRP
jgi:4-hydroxy-tetrahydrodipicolinate reductase